MRTFCVSPLAYPTIVCVAHEAAAAARPAKMGTTPALEVEAARRLVTRFAFENRPDVPDIVAADMHRFAVETAEPSLKLLP